MEIEILPMKYPWGEPRGTSWKCVPPWDRKRAEPAKFCIEAKSDPNYSPLKKLKRLENLFTLNTITAQGHVKVSNKPECSTWHKFPNPGPRGPHFYQKCPISNPGGTIWTKNVLFPNQGAGFWSNNVLFTTQGAQF